jgi:hypothetical protein
MRRPCRVSSMLLAVTVICVPWLSGCGVSARNVTISVARRVDGVVTPILEEQQILVFPYRLWREQRDLAEARLKNLEADLETLLDQVERDADPTEEKIAAIGAAFDELRQFARECRCAIPEFTLQADSARSSFSRGGLAARLERRQEKLDLIEKLKSDYAALRRHRHMLVDLQALRLPAKTFTTNSSGFVTVPMAEFKVENNADGKEEAAEDPETDPMRNKWVLATIVSGVSEVDFPQYARVVVDEQPENKYQLVVK